METTLAKWFDLLNFYQDTPQNKELMKEFFFHQFAQQPQYFYRFLHHFKTSLKNCHVKEKRQLTSSRYLSILSFLCERFGFYEEKIKLDDLCFKYCCPSDYQKISKYLAEYKHRSKNVIDKITKKLKKTLHEKGLHCTIYGRYKSIFSIYKKIELGRKKLDQIRDIFAFRVVTEKNSVEDCFEALSILHDRYLPVARHFKDYITIPKVNGYQSFHTGLKNIVPEYKKPIEVQIRTPEMEEFAEKGFASHWAYNLNKNSFLNNEKEKKLVEHFSALSREKSSSPHVHCFSYRGDLFTLKRGSNVKHFAERVHSRLRERAVGALVNGKRENLSYQIQDGDKIQVLENTTL